MHELPLLVNIAVALAAALVGGLLARRARVPPLVGYLVAGMAIGPFTPGFVGDADTIGQLAELGVVFLMFGVGLHFSLARPVARARGGGAGGARARWRSPPPSATASADGGAGRAEASIVLGLAISIASTVVLLAQPHGRGAPRQPPRAHRRRLAGARGPGHRAAPADPARAGLGPDGRRRRRPSASRFSRPRCSSRSCCSWARASCRGCSCSIARMQSRELFLLVALTLSLGIALTAATLFGVSIALGAFLAGVVVAESPLSHQVGADVLPFREAFAVLFFVSVGMLVDPRDLVANAGAGGPAHHAHRAGQGPRRPWPSPSCCGSPR